MADFEGSLASASLSQYHSGLLELGVASHADLVDAEDEDLEGIGMKKVEIGRLRRRMADGGGPGNAGDVVTVHAVPADEPPKPMMVPDWNSQGQQQQLGGTMAPVQQPAPVHNVGMPPNARIVAPLEHLNSYNQVAAGGY